MKKITLEKLSLENFKGIKSLEINFNENVTEILGDNGTGKTTVFDAFTWLMFGKDHTDSAKFEIKTLKSNNEHIPKLTHSVEANFNVDGKKVIAKRVYKEKWVKQRASLESVLTGHTTDYFYDEVPISLKDFNDKMKEIVDESIFKLITNPFYFNSLAWLTRRQILTNIAKIESDEQLASSNSDFTKLFDEISGRSFEDFKKIISSKKKTIKSQLDEIPTRIDELYKSIPEKEDFNSVRKSIEAKNDEIEKLNEQIIDSSKVDESHSKKISEQHKVVTELNEELNKSIHNARKICSDNKDKLNSQIFEKKSEVQKCGFEITEIENELEFSVKTVEKLEHDISSLREEFTKEHSKQAEFDDVNFSCPTCKRDFEPEKIHQMKDEMVTNFNSDKANTLNDINKRGGSFKERLIGLKKSIEDQELKLASKKSEHDSLKKELSEIEAIEIPLLDAVLYTKEYKELVKQFKLAEKELLNLKNAVKEEDNTVVESLKKEISFLKDEIVQLSKTLYKEEEISKGTKRIEELEKSSSKYAQELADLEKKEYLMDSFNSYKMDRIEESINGLFPSVKFKLFNVQLNGGVAECCDTLINGVPFENANNAAKINSGIEIINVLSAFHECSAPIFVDNAESVVKLTKTDSQIIKLVVSEKHKTLTVN